MTKKLLAILITVILTVSCMMVPAMAADLVYELDATKPTTVEMEWVYYDYLENPETIPAKATNGTDKQWMASSEASNGYVYYIGWQSSGAKTKTFYVTAPADGLYDVEFVSHTKDDLSVVSVYVGATLIGNTGTSEGESVYEETLKSYKMKKYTMTDVPLTAGNNEVRVVTTTEGSKTTSRNAYVLDYVRFTPTGEEVEIPFEVVSFEDNSVDATFFSLYFSKPLTETTGIEVTAQEGTAELTIDESNNNKVKITGIAGRTTITVPAGFTGGTGNETTEKYETTAFAYPLVNTSGKSYPTTSDNMSNASIRKVGGYAGAASVGMKKVQWFPVLAIYDGDKLVASKVGNKVEGAWNGGISLILDEGVKFTEAKIFAWWQVGDEWIPLGPSRSATAESLGFTFDTATE